MDILSGQELTSYTSTALHIPRRPANVLTIDPDRSLFETIEDRNQEQIADFAHRRARAKLANTSAFGGDVFAAVPRFYNPKDYWETSQIPWDVSDDKERFELYQWLELFYRTHYLVPILVDIFTRFPLVGMELASPDDQLNDFYSDLFFDRLNYEQFLVDLGREYWTMGQSFPFGHFNEVLGIWEDEELLDPTLVDIKQYSIIGGKQFLIKPPSDLIEIVKKRYPREQFYLLEKNYPEIIPFLQQGKPIPMSDVLLKQVAFKASPRDLHGTPILLRALRTLMHEEKLMASQDAIAERLYSPLILVKLGVQDMGPNRPPWIPGPAEVNALRNDLDLALAADFRLLVHHFGIDVQNVFGREQMPRLDADFDRVERRIMQVFGVNPSLLSGGTASQPYASSALQAEFLNQILRTYQGYLRKHYESRAAIVAEAQEHYAYEQRGDKRIPIVEEVLEYDEEGNQIIVEKKKLMYPELRMKVLDLRDEATQRQFLQALKAQGVPIADQHMAMGMHYDFKEELDLLQEELIQKTVATAEAKVKTYRILAALGYPIPPDLKAEVEQLPEFAPPEPGTGTRLDVNTPQRGENIIMPGLPEGGPPPIGPPPAGPRNPSRGQVPEESTERGIGPSVSPELSQGPQLPGVPGQPGALGLPGAPTPAINPARSSQHPIEPIFKESILRTGPKGPDKKKYAELRPYMPDDTVHGNNGLCVICNEGPYSTMPMAEQHFISVHDPQFDYSGPTFGKTKLPRNKSGKRVKTLHPGAESDTISED